MDTAGSPSEDKGKGKEVELDSKDSKDAKTDDKKGDKEPPPPMVPFFTMFRYATPLDKALMFFGTLGALANGASMYSLLFIYSSYHDLKYLFLVLPPNFSYDLS